ncbi:MAG: cytochrome c3 family protein [Pyrinomonadaceae bacterium]
MINGTRSNQVLKLVLTSCAVTIFAASCIQQAAKTTVTLTASETPDPVPQRASDKTFKDFSHNIEEHKEFECASCHQREGKSLDMEFAGHDSCIGCHLNQFTDQEPVMCSICHDDLTTSPPTMQKFPENFREGFNMKFEHSAHDSGEGRPPAGCASCHQSAGAGKSIPVGFRAHNTCYTCHTAESDIGSCNVCHELAPYRRTPPSRYVFGAVFRHDDHSSSQGVNCNDCHSVRPGAPQGRQVSNIAAAQHNCGSVNNCNTCHDGSRAFSGNDFLNMGSCVRCHSGSGFDMIPGGPCRK